MLKLLKPKESFKRIEDIDLKNYIDNFDALIIDLDNTLVTRGSEYIEEDVLKWIEYARKHFKIGIISNNYKNRVKFIEKRFGFPSIGRGFKPLPFSFKKLLKILKAKKEKTIVIGDQIFTDILGGNLLGCYTILVEPKDKSKDFFLTKITRFFESLFRKNIL